MSVREDENFDPTMDIKHYGAPNVDTTGMPPALAERVKKKPGRPAKPKAEPAAVDLKTHIEELLGKRAAEAAERKAMAEEIERLKAELDMARAQTASNEELDQLRTENAALRKKLATAERRGDISKQKWRIWKYGIIVADGVPLEEAVAKSGLSKSEIMRIRRTGNKWKVMVEGDEGYEG